MVGAVAYEAHLAEERAARAIQSMGAGSAILEGMTQKPFAHRARGQLPPIGRAELAGEHCEVKRVIELRLPLLLDFKYAVVEEVVDHRADLTRPTVSMEDLESSLARVCGSLASSRRLSLSMVVRR